MNIERLGGNSERRVEKLDAKEKAGRIYMKSFRSEHNGSSEVEKNNNGWDEVAEYGKDHPLEMNQKGFDGGEEKTEAATESSVEKRRRISLAAAKVREAYDSKERSRIDRMKSELWGDPDTYQNERVVAEPSTARKAARLLADRLGIRLGRSERRRDDEAKQKALDEARSEKRAEEEEQRQFEERIMAEMKAAGERSEAEERERDRIILEREMAEGHDLIERASHERYQKQRIQEIVERDLNANILKVEDLDAEAYAENPEVQKHNVPFEDGTVTVYDLKGIPFKILSTTVDYRDGSIPNDIGTETYKKVMDDPGLWARTRDQAKQIQGFGTRAPNALGNTISTSYYNSERNIDTYVPGELIFGFEGVSADCILKITNGDGATSNMGGDAETELRRTGDIERLEGAEGVLGYNEVTLRRYDENGRPKLPDYVVCRNRKISDASLRAAKYFEIPIINIDEAAYKEKNRIKGESLINSISENDSYEEIDGKLEELKSMSMYKAYPGFGVVGMGARIDDILDGEKTYGEDYCAAMKIERRKRLEYIQSSLEGAIRELESATEGGVVAPNVLSQFEGFDVLLYDLQNGTCETKRGVEKNGYGGPGSCNFIDVKFRLRGSTRSVATKIYDGQRIIKPDEAIASYYLSQKDLEDANSSYYDRLAPVVKKYFEAVRRNRELVSGQQQ